MEKQARSRAYPAIDLEEATEALRKVPVSMWRNRTRDQIAELLGYSSGYSGAAARKVAALGHFGYLRCSNKLYFPTKLAEQVTQAAELKSSEAAVRQAFLQPALFREVASKYEVLGRLPWQLADTLADYGITDSAKEEAARILVRSGQYAGLLEEDGTFRESYYLSFDRPQPQLVTRPLTPANLAEDREADSAPSDQVFCLTLTDSKKAEIRLPFRLNELDLELLKAQISVLELQVRANKAVQPTQLRPVRRSS